MLIRQFRLLALNSKVTTGLELLNWATEFLIKLFDDLKTSFLWLLLVPANILDEASAA